MVRQIKVQPATVSGNKITIDIDSFSDQVEWIKWVNTQFQKFSDDGKLCKTHFKKALGLKTSFFADRFFALFDTDGSGDLQCGELVNCLHLLKNGTYLQKLQFLFEVFDLDGDGNIDQYELQQVLKSCKEESSLQLSNEDLEDLTEVLFKEADVDNSGTITFDEFQSALEQHPGLIDDLTLSATQWFEIPRSRPTSRCSRYCSRTYLKHNTSKIVFIVLFILANLGFGAYAAWNHCKSNGFLITARIAGMNLNFTCTLVLVLMLRHTLNLVRSTILRRILPLDEHVLFHKYVGLMITIYSAVHIVGHLGNGVLLDRSREDLPLWKILFTDTLNDFGLVNGSAFITGWILTVILIVLVVFSLPCVREKIYQVFHMLHFLCIPFWIVLIIHCQNFLYWFIVPGTIFVVEQIYRIKWIKQFRYGRTHIEKVTLLPCGIPAISPYEFHPFTISSAPELKDRIWLHVRTTGNWTNDLYKYLSNYDPGEDSEPAEPVSPMITVLQQKRIKMDNNSRRKSIIDRLNGLLSTLRRRSSVEDIDAVEIARQKRIQQKTKSVHIRCFLDGPFGTASREALNTEHAILIGAGIGVTPMASVLQSILHMIKQNKRKCPNCSHCWYDAVQESVLTIKKVDFIWINRDQRCFEWFVHVLKNFELEQSLIYSGEDRLVNIHLYMTSAIKKNHMEGVGLQLALEVVHKKEQKDFFTGLQTKTQAGRPNWDQIFGQISLQKTGKKKVFFCGPNPMADTVKKACEKYSFAFAKEVF